MTAHQDPLAAAEHNAHVWLAAVAEKLGTDDRRLTLRVLRAWLHVTRDRLPVDGVAHLGAQLPELMRGVYFEGWTPNRPSVRSTAADLVEDFARAAHLQRDEAPKMLSAVTSVLWERFSPGQMEHVLIQLSRPLREALSGEREAAAPRRHERSGGEGNADAVQCRPRRPTALGTGVPTPAGGVRPAD